MAPIFISYRRNDTSAHVRALRDRIAEEFGVESVFLDVEHIEPGDDFLARIEEHLKGCKVFLVAIGPTWNVLTDARVRHLDRPSDFVRIEICAALRRPELRVVPLLIDGASMPTESELPHELERLGRCSAFELDYRRNFSSSARALVQHISRWLRPTSPQLPPTEQVSMQRPTVAPKPKWADRAGRDEFGRWADLDCAGVVQRLRFIEPGQFFMGAGRREPGRRAHESPSHPVALSAGFWLADTACTQELWHAITKTRPSKFEGLDQHPVESVSWNDVVERFLPALASELRVHAGLPTEAEWEYACRAGSLSAYAWGDDLAADDANFEQASSESLPIGIGRTCIVKRYRANAFGLYEMHGNVWEWCDDDLRPYEVALVTDPHGGHEGPLRAVRGGSWNNVAARARSAYRRAVDRDYCRPFIGFRIKLASR